MYELRKYQTQAIRETRQAFRDGNKEVILMLPTGAGKSIVIRKIIELSKQGMKLLFVVHRTILINQMRETLKGLDVEISTLQTKGKNPTELYDLIIHDECHYSWGSKLKNNLNYKFYLGLSATPTCSEGYPLKADKIISFMQMPDLIEQGFAVPFKVLSTSKIDTTKLKKTGADYNNKQAFELMDKSEIKKDILDTYFKHCHGLTTLVYAVNIQHAEELHKEFLEAGVHNEVIHSKKRVDDIIDRFKSGEVKVLINVSILTIGFDFGDLECLLLASPTKSVILAQQIYGRVSRLPINSNKKEGLIIDCANVIQDTIHPMQRLDFNRAKGKKKVKSCKNCKNDLIIIDKKVRENDAITYTEITTYKCSVCSEVEILEEMKVLNLAFCSKCSEQLTETHIEMKQTDKNIEFYITCDSCGEVEVKREILLSEKELKEIKHEEIMKAEPSWERVELMLREDCKKAGYNWRYSLRLIDIMQSKNKTPQEVEMYINNIRESGAKISSLSFKG